MGQVYAYETLSSLLKDLREVNKNAMRFPLHVDNRTLTFWCIARVTLITQKVLEECVDKPDIGLFRLNSKHCFIGCVYGIKVNDRGKAILRDMHLSRYVEECEKFEGYKEVVP